MEPSSSLEEKRRVFNNGLTQIIIVLQNIRDNSSLTQADKLTKLISIQNLFPTIRRNLLYFINTEKK